MNLERLTRVLRATRPDLIDGFPSKYALQALTSEGSVLAKRDLLNELLLKHNARVVIKPAMHDSYFSEHGLIGAHISPTGFIEIYLSERFFSNSKMPLKQALRFQSIMTHELIHRDQIDASGGTIGSFKSDEELVDVAYVNNPLELEAMCGEVIHDLASRSVLGEESMIEGSPRLNYITRNARYLSPESIAYFQQEMAEGSLKVAP